MLLAVSKQLAMIFGRALRESGQALDRVGSRLTRDVAYMEKYSRHRRLMPLDQLWPSYGKSFVAPNATLIGEVRVGNDCSVWYGVVLRGDLSAIRIDDNVHIGENSVIQTVKCLPRGIPNSVNIASDVLIEPGTTIVSSIIDSGVWIQSGAFVQQGAKIEREAILLSGAVVGPGNTVPAFTVYGGYPGKVIREVNEEDLKKKEEAFRSFQQHALRNQELLQSLGH
jgi:carbonic anhydrase/acetyltransferase-like protein (isoleucine patch superfamily)